MSVDRSRLLTQSAALFLAAGAMVACSDPENRTDLRPAGNPEILSVVVMNDPVDNFVETATFCKVGDDKRPGLIATNVGPVQVCVDDLSKPAGFETTDPMTDEVTFTEAKVEDAIPMLWYARVEFDELLDPSVETLVEIPDDEGMPSGTFEGHIMNTLPFELDCGGQTIAYDGYYSPSGNNVTWPVGPSLVVHPIDPTTVATSSTCTIKVKDVVKDKDGNGVPDPGVALDFKIAPLALQESDPAEPEDPTMPELRDPAAPVSLLWNAAVDPTSLTPAEVQIEEVTTCDQAGAGTARTAKIAANADDPTITEISDAGAAAMLSFEPMKIYRITFAANNAVTDLAGGPGAVDAITLCFQTDAAM